MHRDETVPKSSFAWLILYPKPAPVVILNVIHVVVRNHLAGCKKGKAAYHEKAVCGHHAGRQQRRLRPERKPE